MNFFEAQELARKRSRKLVLLFAAALVAIIVAVYVAVELILVVAGIPRGAFDPAIFAAATIATGTLVMLGSTFRTLQLRAGGSRVAILLGGRPVAPDTGDPAERRLFNVVEEMAVASGTPVPAVFVLPDERGINAFAAGYTIHDAAVAVTRGALDQLNREELQGVIAHEFSHILNGDMRLNIRLVGLLYGILLLTVIGRGMLRGGLYRGRRGSVQIGALGGALVVIGSIGVFFGRLIKAAVSRQREFLADASAVQFTRNPDGIADALKKIGGASAVGGSRIRDHHAEELSHLFFADGMRASALTGLLSTHPSLEERIRKIQPSWDGNYIPIRPAPDEAPEEAARSAAGGAAGGARFPGIPGFPGGEALPGTAALPGAMILMGGAMVMESIGSPTPGHVQHAARLLDGLPDPLRAAVHDPIGARAVIVGLLLSDDDDVAARQWEVIRGYADGELVRPVERLAPALAAQPPEHRLPLLDLAIPALRQFSPSNADAFHEVVNRMVRADGRARIFDFALLQILARQLPGAERPDRMAAGSIHSLAPVRDDVERLLSAVARAGAASPEEAEHAFAAGAARLPASATPWRLRGTAEIGGFSGLTKALAAIGRGDLGVRGRFLEACAHCIAYDGKVRAAEAEIFRAIAEALDVPAPPLLPG